MNIGLDAFLSPGFGSHCGFSTVSPVSYRPSPRVGVFFTGGALQQETPRGVRSRQLTPTQRVNTPLRQNHPERLAERETRTRRSTPVTVVSQPKSCFFHTPIFSSLTSRCRLPLRCDCVNNVLPQRPSSSVTESLSPFVVTCRPTRSKFPSHTGAV